MTKNRQKNGSLNRDLLNFLYRYGIFWMPPGESSHPGGSEYVWQRGVEGISGQVTGGRSLPYFPKKNTTKMSRPKKQLRPQLSKYCFQSESGNGDKFILDGLVYVARQWSTSLKIVQITRRGNS